MFHPENALWQKVVNIEYQTAVSALLRGDDVEEHQRFEAVCNLNIATTCMVALEIEHLSAIG